MRCGCVSARPGGLVQASLGDRQGCKIGPIRVELAVNPLRLAGESVPLSARGGRVATGISGRVDVAILPVMADPGEIK